MKRRITVQMVRKAQKTYDRGAIDEIFEEWMKEYVYDKKYLSERLDYILITLGMVLYRKEFSDSQRISILNSLVDEIGLTLFTPKAWEIAKEEVIMDINENYNVDIKKVKEP